MESSIFNFVVRHRSMPPSWHFEKLEEMKPGLFTPLRDLFDSDEFGKLSLLYIIYAYSKESPLLVMGERFSDQKAKIAEYVGLPDILFGPVVLMQNEVVREVVTDYLNYQQDRRWMHLMQDRELYEAMLEEGLRNLRRDDGTVDYKGMVDAAKYRRELLKQIELQEAAFAADGEFGFVLENNEEIQKIAKDYQYSRSLKLEHSPHIRT